MSKTNLQSTHWIQKIAEEIFAWQKKHDIERLHVDDMKTPSGRVHTGALRGVMIHDIVARELAKSSDQKITSTYVFNDMDPMDGLPAYLDPAEYSQHMGKPLYKIPTPTLEKSGVDFSKATADEKERYRNAKSFAEFYAMDFIDAFRKLGCTQELVWSHELYESGKMDAVIRTALDHVDDLRRIYKEVADYNLPEQWYPFQVICPQCGKLGTTLVTDWNGEQVTFECQPNKVKWAEGCGHSGKVSPFGGTGKLLWKVDWPGHWKTLGVTVEGAGKDHSSAGGSRDMAVGICREVFGIPNPFDIPYEWILIRGSKMSSSKGVGTSAREFVELFPAEVGRFLFVNKFYSQVIDFDPATMAIPDLFDEYDQGARIFWKQEEGDQRLGFAFERSQLGENPAPHFLPRFRDVALWMNYPELNLEQKFAEVKGSALTDQEKTILVQRKACAQIWIDRYAPEDFRLQPTKTVPAEAAKLTTEQKTFLTAINELVDSKTWDMQELQQAIFELAKKTLSPKLGFAAIYLSFLGKTAGPRAGAFLLSMDPEFRRQRIAEVTSGQNASQTEHLFEDLNQPDRLRIDQTVKEKYPTVCLGFAILRGVKIAKTDPKLEEQKAEFLKSLEGLTTDAINAFPEVQSYRQMYKAMGIDWHSRRPSPEALLRRIAQGKALYNVNTCVDAYNLVVMKHRISVGAFDLKNLQEPVVLKVAEGGEQILLLGDQEPTTLKAGEVSYFDQAGPYNLDFNYRDAQRTMVTESTTDLVINVDGVNSISRAQVEQSLKETIEMIQKYCGGTVEITGIVE
jgi:lysyl-tRNA synthetase, class I